MKYAEELCTRSGFLDGKPVSCYTCLELWRGFCEENSIKKNSIDYVERI